MKRIVTTMLCGFYLSCAAAQHVSGQYITDGNYTVASLRLYCDL